LKEAVSELQKVVYPTGQQLVNYFIVVLVFVLFIIAIVSLLDMAFGKAILAIFGS
jgi:preprotein translocase subunit SecE